MEQAVRSLLHATPVCTPTLRSGTHASGLQYLQRAVDDERSERTRSVPSVASRRVAAPYADGRSCYRGAIPKQNFTLATLAILPKSSALRAPRYAGNFTVHAAYPVGACNE